MNAAGVRENTGPVALQKKLREISGKNVLLMITDNTQRMLSLKKDQGVITLRAHKMFLEADTNTINSLGRWIGGKRCNHLLVQKFIDANSSKVRKADPALRRRRITTAGKYHDLAEIATEINTRYLDNRAKAPVSWGRKVSRRTPRSIRLGSYDPVSNFITISQRLDRKDIPRYMVEYVVFHEMLHEILGIGERADGRRDIHGSMFKMMEETFPHYNKAREFEKKKWGGLQ